jgi:protein-S-isoprenylcysteine O-methyltransferase Ste14
LRLYEIFYSVTTGSERRRKVLTPIGGLVFTVLLLLVAFGSLYTDRVFDLRPFLPTVVAFDIGLPLLGVGLILWIWCILLFKKARGTPVPFNPPRQLVTSGPYAKVRNPMLAGVFASLLGLGFCLNSASMVLLWTPIFLLLNAIGLKVIEEPELERRFGASYTKYKERVPMFIPRIFSRRSSADDNTN